MFGFVLLATALRGRVAVARLDFLRYEILAEMPNRLEIFAFFAGFFGAERYAGPVFGGP
jgi:hypothetical protein